ncbi:uncharacterized protein K489DRAFT_241161 [Dissoconium aciculare CBS 342.82]|uniref:Uncharacterized protein n=1 Tax=Dissoconium aciculare CBS 342.82 TaxID=1314786 RepID=A0A6J3M4G0_9PEZI|nr:uncharacterized protein K489DRAFT_241161 [Dissoconium aciculare CBS 342.82]KAF1822369.1 hypothetical protein K489DRAFT_241161 [Dissoconium aciculare CBS 342.82]
MGAPPTWHSNSVARTQGSCRAGFTMPVPFLMSLASIAGSWLRLMIATLKDHCTTTLPPASREMLSIEEAPMLRHVRN